MTYSDLIIAAIQRVTSGGDVPSQDDVTMGLSRLNDLFDAWKIEGLLVNTISRVTWALTGASSYTVGATGTVVVDRPVNAAGLVFALLDSTVSPAVERPLATYTQEQYQSIVLKTLTATYPLGFYYNPTTPLGTLIPYPIATGSSLSGVMYAGSPAGEVLLTDTVTLPQGYRRFVRDNLAVELAPDFDLQPSQALIQSAIESKASVKRSNVRLSELESEAAALGGTSGSSSISGFYAGTP